MGPKQNSRPLCLGCYKDVDCSFVCPRCGWPMCGPECCSKPQHAAECQITPTGAREKIKVSLHRNLIGISCSMIDTAKHSEHLMLKMIMICRYKL